MARFLPETIESVLRQSYPHIDYRVLDGGSTDGTLDLLRGYEGRFEWRSARDNGAAAALREGFAVARGAILGWVNADDVLLPGAVEGAVLALAAHPEAAAVFGQASWIDEAGRLIAPYPVLANATSVLDLECAICQPACFFRASAYRAAGGIDARWGSAFDYDLWIRLARVGPFIHVNQDWARSRMHRGNKTLGNRGQAFAEGMAILERHFGYVPAAWIHSEYLWSRDQRDQFFEPSRGSLRSWLGCLPEGMRRNHRRWRRYIWDWLTLPLGRASGR